MTVDGTDFTVRVATGSGFSSLEAGVTELVRKINEHTAVDYAANVDGTGKIIKTAREVSPSL